MNRCLLSLRWPISKSFQSLPWAYLSNPSSNRAGSVKWFAPELINPEQFGCEQFVRTCATDVYAFVCVCLEVRFIAARRLLTEPRHLLQLETGAPPFANFPDVPAMFKVLAGERPERPESMSDLLMPRERRNSDGGLIRKLFWAFIIELMRDREVCFLLHCLLLKLGSSNGPYPACYIGIHFFGVFLNFGETHRRSGSFCACCAWDEDVRA
jgi:hypothetical protein